MIKKITIRDYVIASLIIFLLYLLFFRGGKEIDYSSYEKKIEDLSQTQDSLIGVNSYLSIQIQKRDSSIKESENKVQYYVLKNKKIQEDANKKVAAIDKLSDDELVEFFSSRYK